MLSGQPPRAEAKWGGIEAGRPRLTEASRLSCRVHDAHRARRKKLGGPHHGRATGFGP